MWDIERSGAGRQWRASLALARALVELQCKAWRAGFCVVKRIVTLTSVASPSEGLGAKHRGRKAACCAKKRRATLNPSFPAVINAKCMISFVSHQKTLMATICQSVRATEGPKGLMARTRDPGSACF